MKIQSICICGGGSLGLVCAGVFLSKRIKVSILTGHPEKWSKHIKVYDPLEKEYSGVLTRISSDPEEVIPSADLVFLTVPGFLIDETLRNIKDFLNHETIVGSVVSSTGFFFAAHEILGDKHCMFGFQRVPYIARLRKYGAIGELLGYKDRLNIAVENHPSPKSLINELQVLFDTPINLLSSFYEASLTNSNPILHTGRLYSLWKDYDGEIFENPPMFYADWTIESSEYIIRMDEEFQKILRKLGIKENVILPLLDYYESLDEVTLTEKIKSIRAFQSIKSPMRETEVGWIPDFSSRYFTEDFPYGLRYIKEIAAQLSISVPMIDEVYNWGVAMIGKEYNNTNSVP